MLEVIDPCDLLILVLPLVAKPHSFETSLEKLPQFQPAVALQPTDAQLAPRIELAQMTIRDLRQIAKERAIARYSRLTKAELIAKLG